MLICGTGSFSSQSDNEENEAYNSNTSPCTTPKRSSKRSTSLINNKNPYADRGLDKFYALLADLDTKKQHIYTQKGSKDISLVRFTYTNDSEKVKPIVVRVKNKNKQEKQNNPTKILDKKHSSVSQNSEIVEVEKQSKKQGKKQGRSLSCSGSFKVENLKKPCVYLPVVLVMILMFLVVFGRSFAILCASIGWYLVPSLIGESVITEDEAKSKQRKREYSKRLSEKKINVHSEGPSSPTSVLKFGER